MTWHSAYRERVLEPDYTFAERHLAPHLLDALSAHVKTVARLPMSRPHQTEIKALLAALRQLYAEPPIPYDPGVPDLYFAVNRRLEATLGEPTVSFLRLGLSRNDLDMTVYKLRARELLLSLGQQLCALRGAILKQAETHLETVLIAYTHHQPGQPTTVAHYLAAIEGALARDSDRLLAAFERLNTCPLGAAALAGSSHPLDRAYTAQLLGFLAPVENTYDAVAASDWQLDIVGVSQSCAVTSSRFVCDLLNWASQGVFRLGDGLVQGSSVMPQKRNPVALEHARTRFSRVLGASQMVLYSSHNIPYGDLNDFGPDIQGALQTLFLQLSGGLALLHACLTESSFNTVKLAELAAATDTTATELADELTRRGLSFQAAHRLVGQLVARLQDRGEPLQRATAHDLEALGGPALSDALSDALNPELFVRRRSGLGGPAPEAVKAHLLHAAQRLAENSATLDGVQTQLNGAQRSLRAPGKEYL